MASGLVRPDQRLQPVTDRLLHKLQVIGGDVEHNLLSPLSPEDCARRLAEALGEGGDSLRDTGRLFSGWVRENGFSLRLASRSRNPFAPYFQGSLERIAKGTVLRGEFKLHEGVKWAAIAWGILWGLVPCGLTAVVEVGWISFLVTVGESLRNLGDELTQTMMAIPVVILLFPVVGVAFGIGFPVLFIAVRRGDRARMIELLKRILDVEDCSAA